MIKLQCDKCNKEVKQLFSESGDPVNYGQPDNVNICGDCLKDYQSEVIEEISKLKEKYFTK